jgi:hypothetical protein
MSPENPIRFRRRCRRMSRTRSEGALVFTAALPIAAFGTGYSLVGLLVIVLLVVLIMRLI